MKYPSPSVCVLPAGGQCAGNRDMSAFGDGEEKGVPQELDHPSWKSFMNTGRQTGNVPK